MKRVDFLTIDSTNEEAKRRVHEACEFFDTGEIFDTVITARAQTAGRGRRGRDFFSPDTGDSVYMSFILRPPKRREAEQLLTVAAAVAVCRAVAVFDAATVRSAAESSDCAQAVSPRTEPLPPRIAPLPIPPSPIVPTIKWVNDVLVDGKKVCGILAERVPSAVILGIGININIPDRDFPEELRGRAGSLWLPPLERGRFIETVCANVFDTYAAIESGRDHDIVGAYLCYENTTGHRVLVTKFAGGDVIPAFAKAIAEDGGLVVVYGDGSEEILRAGEVSVLPLT